MSAKTDKGETPEPKTEAVADAVEGQPEGETPEVEKWDEARAMETIKKLRAAEAQGKKDAKRLAELEAQEQTRKEAEMTDIQKAVARAEAAERKARAAELALMRRSVATKTKLPDALADRIQGETLEDMEADALTIIAAIPTVSAPKLEPTNPGHPQTGETDAERRKRLGL